MDVHHHSHGGHGKRNWKSYVWEFLMLFLAVFCGYLAEYKLEHTVEHSREVKYMKSMLVDLRSDTTMITQTLHRAQKVALGLDSLQNNLYNYKGGAETTRMMYAQNFMYMCWLKPDFNDRTIAQLRYSGKMRLIEDEEIADEISAYWIGVERIMKNSDEYINDLDKAEDLMAGIFNRKYIHVVQNDPYYGLDRYEVDSQAVLMTQELYVLETYANRIGRMNDIVNLYLIPLLHDQLKAAQKLTALICKEYHIQ